MQVKLHAFGQTDLVCMKSGFVYYSACWRCSSCWPRRSKQVFWALGGADKPLDKAIRRLSDDPRLLVYLAPAPGGSGSTLSATSHPKRKDEGQLSSQNKPNKKAAAKPEANAGPPEELKHLNLRGSEGKLRCWCANMACGCKNSVIEGRCQFGLHQCMKCGKAGHGAFNRASL